MRAILALRSGRTAGCLTKWWQCPYQWFGRYLNGRAGLRLG